MGSLKEYVVDNPSRHNAENFMRKNSITVYVEGTNDEKLFRSFFDDEVCKVRSCKDKPGVIENIKKTPSISKLQIIGIVDTDFDYILNRTNCDPHLFCVDYHDVEIMMIETGNFKKVMLEVLPNISPVKGASTQIRLNAYKMAYPLGCIRLINEVENLGIAFKYDNDDFASTSRPWSEFVVFSGKDVSEINYEKLAALYATKRMTSAALTQKLIEATKKYQNDLCHICCGHDVTDAIAFLVSKETKKPVANMKMRIESYLRTSYQEMHFARTSLYKSLLKYETDFKVRLFPAVLVAM